MNNNLFDACARRMVNVANQVNVPADLYPRYEWSGRTIEYHRAQIREFLGFREATVQDGAELVTWFAERVLPLEHREDHVREALFERCRALRIEHDPAGPTTKTSFALDNRRALDVLGWKPEVSFDEGVCRTVQWWKKTFSP